MTTPFSNTSKNLTQEEQDAARAFMRDHLLTRYNKTQLAELLELAPASVSRIVRGKQVVTPYLVVKLCGLTGKPMQEVVGIYPKSYSHQLLGQAKGYLEIERQLRSSRVLPVKDEVWLIVRDLQMPEGKLDISAQNVYMLTYAIAQIVGLEI